MKETHQAVEQDNTQVTPVREPLFRRYQIKIKAGVQAGKAPFGVWPIR